MGKTRNLSAAQAGFSMMEVLVAMAVFAIVALGAAQSTIYAVKFQKYAEVSNAARNLAVSKAEELTGVDLALLDDRYDLSESDIAVVGHNAVKFNRSTNVSVNSDGSRTVDITVSSSSPLLRKPIQYSTRFAPWES